MGERGDGPAAGAPTGSVRAAGTEGTTETSWSARLRRILAPTDEVDAARDRAAAAREGYDSVRDIVGRQKVRLRGFVSSMVIHPRSAPDTVEAELFDGTGTITLIWLGRTSIPGIRPGTRMAVSGFAALRSQHRVMYNPRYELIGAPDEESER